MMRWTGVELVETFRRAGVPEALYDIPDVHEVPIQPDAYYFLRLESGSWIVGVRERSRDSVLGLFTTEDQACRYLRARLAELPSPAPDAAERIEEVIAQREEIQRHAWRAFARASHEHKSPEHESAGSGEELPPQ